MIQTATKIRILGLVILIIIALTPQPQNTNTINDILKTKQVYSIYQEIVVTGKE
jgi:hypothetical protein